MRNIKSNQTLKTYLNKKGKGSFLFWYVVLLGGTLFFALLFAVSLYSAKNIECKRLGYDFFTQNGCKSFDGHILTGEFTCHGFLNLKYPFKQECKLVQIVQDNWEDVNGE